MVRVAGVEAVVETQRQGVVDEGVVAAGALSVASFSGRNAVERAMVEKRVCGVLRVGGEDGSRRCVGAEVV